MKSLESLYDGFDHIEAMKEHLVIMKQQYAEVSEKENAAKNEVHASRVVLDGLRTRLESEGNDKSQWLVKQLAEAEEAHNVLIKDLKQWSRTREQKNEDIRLQQHAIANGHLLSPITLKEVLAHQENLTQAESDIVRIKNLIAQQTPIINRLTIAELPLNSLLQQKEDILADIATGESTEKELKKINQQIELVQINIEQAQVDADKAKAAQIGLERKLDEAKRALDELQAKNTGVLECLLYALAEEEGGRYFKMAAELQKSYMRLVGLDNLIKQKSLKRRGISPDDWELKLPGFKLAVAQEYMKEGDPLFFDWQAIFSYQRGALKAMEAEVQALKKSGVTLV